MRSKRPFRSLIVCVSCAMVGCILRILWTTIYNDHNARIKEEQNHGKH